MSGLRALPKISAGAGFGPVTGEILTVRAILYPQIAGSLLGERQRVWRFPPEPRLSGMSQSPLFQC